MKPAEQQTQLFRAIDAHRGGRLAEAESIYRRILGANPRHADAQHLLGLALHQQGRSEEGAKLIRQAIRLNGKVADYHNNLGEVLRAMGQAAEAAAAYERALALDPKLAMAWNNLGIAREALKEDAKAREAYRRALALKPDYFEAWNNLGVLEDRLRQFPAAREALEQALRLAPRSAQVRSSWGNLLQNLERYEEAITAYDQALALDPRLYQADYNRANALGHLERHEEAAAGYEACLRKNPNYADARNNYGHVLQRLRRPEEGLRQVRQALALDPLLGNAWNNLGIALREAYDLDGARQALERAIELMPDDHKPWSNLAMVFQGQQRWKECFAAIDRALALQPDNPETLNNYGQALAEVGEPYRALAALDRLREVAPLRGTGLVNRAFVLISLRRVPEALECYEQALRLQPANWLWCSNYLYTLNLSAAHEAAAIARLHREVGARLESATPARPPRPVRRRGGRIRVGFVSPDLREHSVARFLGPLWQHHERDRLEFFAYANVERTDHYTATLNSWVPQWRNILGQGDDPVCDQIAADEIDVLVDLAGHTHNNRLRVFALAPAPVQVSWLGYPNTTGLTRMQYRLTDALADPPGSADALHTERLVRLAGSAWCYQPAADTPAIADATARDGKPLTFCSFNNPAKYSARTLALWVEILRRVPGSQLLIKGKVYANAQAREDFLRDLTALGADPARVVLRGWTGRVGEHLDIYNEADIALDPFPYHGTTTTCEALWMGLPVVTLAGAAHLSRVGVSLLTNVGLGDLVAPTEAGYVERAVALAADVDRRRELRRTLRDRMRPSPLMDAAHFAREFTRACERMVAGTV